MGLPLSFTRKKKRYCKNVFQIILMVMLRQTVSKQIFWELFIQMRTASIKFGSGSVNSPQKCCRWLKQLGISSLRTVFRMLFSFSCSAVFWLVSWLVCMVGYIYFVYFIFKTGHYDYMLSRAHGWILSIWPWQGLSLSQSMTIWHSCNQRW